MTHWLTRRCVGLALLAVLLLQGNAAAEPVIVAPQEPVPIGGFADVEISGLEKPASLTWSTIPDVRVRVSAVWGRPDVPILSIPSNQAGTWNLIVACIEGDKVYQKVVVLVIGQPVPPGPTPVPPGPTPVPPVTVGKRTLLIVRETADSTPVMARMVTALRQPPHATYITSKGHALSILDDDSVDENGQPTPRLAAWRPHFSGMTLPVLFVIDTATNTIVHKQSLPADATADAVMQIVRANGG